MPHLLVSLSVRSRNRGNTHDLEFGTTREASISAQSEDPKPILKAAPEFLTIEGRRREAIAARPVSHCYKPKTRAQLRWMLDFVQVKQPERPHGKRTATRVLGQQVGPTVHRNIHDQDTKCPKSLFDLTLQLPAFQASGWIMTVESPSSCPAVSGCVGSSHRRGAPSAMNWRAVSRPIPLVPPVTIWTCSRC